MDKKRQQQLEAAFERIEETILPSISTMLDILLDAANSGQPGIDINIYAAELRTIALQVEELSKQIAAISPGHVDPQGYRISSAA